jgi:hypothetical protein
MVAGLSAATVAAVLPTVMAAFDAVGHHRGSSDDGSGADHRSADDTASAGSSTS